jgi:hypothetical protein
MEHKGLFPAIGQFAILINAGSWRQIPDAARIFARKCVGNFGVTAYRIFAERCAVITKGRCNLGQFRVLF